MASPSIADSNNNGTASGTSHTVNLPPNIAAGDLLIILALTGTATLTFPAGYAQLYVNNSIFHSEGQWKLADGTEGASISVTTSASVTGGWITYRVTGWNTSQNPECPAMATGSTGTSSDPPIVSPSWGSDDNLYIAVSERSNSDNPTFPSGYTLSQVTFVGTANLSAAGKQATSSSDDPAAFTYASSALWRAATIAIRGATATKGFPFAPNPMLPLLVR